jgi:hypothetical protein
MEEKSGIYEITCATSIFSEDNPRDEFTKVDRNTNQLAD